MAGTLTSVDFGRGWLKRASAPLVLAGLLAATSSSFVSAQEATPTPGILETPAAEIDCSTAPAPASAFTIVSEESEVRYIAEEELRGRGAVTAVGKTSAFIGQILFDADGKPMACSRFDADLRTLTSDESRRDNYLYGNVLETETYPLTTFILTEVQGLDGAIGEEEVNIRLIGNLTIRDQTKLVAWDAKVSVKDDTMTGTATLSFEMPDFGITPPKVGPVISLDETLVLEVDIVAKKA